MPALPSLIYPFWLGNIMTEETILLTQYNDGGAAKGSLAFKPKKIIAVTSFDGMTAYSAGRDFSLKGNVITRAPDSAAPFMRFDALVGTNFPNQEFFIAAKPGLPKGADQIFFSGDTSLLPDHQIKVTYEYDPHDVTCPAPKFNEKEIPGTIGKLRNKEDIKVLFYGDSITTGCSSSGYLGIEPRMKTWMELVCQGLEDFYGSRVEYINTAVGGTGSAWGLENVNANIIEHNPDLAVIAFGMNDGALPPEEYRRNIRGMIQAARDTLGGGIEFILVGTMRINSYSAWEGNQALFPEENRKLACEFSGTASADVGAIHGELLKNKFPPDMLVNNINHPNDFVVRLYAMTVLSKLAPLA